MSDSGGISTERLVATLVELARIYSPAGSEAACAAYCAEALTAAGCEVRFDDSAALTGSDTGNLIAELAGTRPGTLVLSAHLDCVEPCRDVDPVVTDGIVHSRGETVLGADDKAGLAAAIECVRVLSERTSRPTVRCVFTVQEEVGLRGAKELRAVDVAGDVCLVLDADGAPGGIVRAAPTHYTFAAEFIGRAAHAGVAPELGVSAMTMAARAITALPAGRLDEKTTANVGTILGGSATNVVAARVDVTGECRSLDRSRADALKVEMDDTMRRVAEECGGEIKIAWTLEYEGFEVSDDEPVVELVRAACASAGLEPHLFATGGGSDANALAALGVPTVALSCGMSGVHGVDEQIAVVDLVALARVCVAAAEQLAVQGA